MIERSGLTIELTSGPAVRVTVTGDVDLPAAAELARPLRELITVTRPAGIDIDLAAVPFMDSTGIQVLVAAHTDAGAVGIALHVVAVSPQVRRILTITGVLGTLADDDLDG